MQIFISLGSQLSAILSTKLICTLRAFKGSIGIFPESLREDKDAKLPYSKGDYRHCKKRKGIEADYKHHRCKHHKMIPVKNTAGGAAFVLHNKTEGTPYKNTDKVAYIKSNAY